MPSQEKQNVDQNNTIEREINGCEVRLFFSSLRNEQAERFVLETLNF